MKAETATSTYHAVVAGEQLQDLPVDLYIPPEALQVVLEMFEGPLDLLLYLIKKHNLDILNIPVAQITRQYIDYLDKMKSIHLEVTADYLEMAALLIEIKSRMMLPRPENSTTEEEEDPRAELIRRLQEYERFKQAATDLDTLPRCERDLFCRSYPVNMPMTKPLPQVQAPELARIFQQILHRSDLQLEHTIQAETLTIRAMMSRLLTHLGDQETFTDFVACLLPEEGRIGVVLTFLAILELTREMMIELVQNKEFGPIYIRAVVC